MLCAVGEGIACQIDGLTGIVKLNVVSVLVGVIFDDRVIFSTDLADNQIRDGHIGGSAVLKRTVQQHGNCA